MGFFTRKKNQDSGKDVDADPKMVRATVVEDEPTRGKGVRVSVSIAESLSPSGSRAKSGSSSNKQLDAPRSTRPGVVSSVLSDPTDASGDSPHRNIVERRFGPSGTSRPLPPPADRDRPPQSPQGSATAASASGGDAASALDLRELETADLEIDSMGHIGRSTTINGDIVAEEDLEIEGTVEGTVTLTEHRLTVGAEGIVKARVKAAGVVVVGRIEGDVTSPGLVEVRAGGYIGGNVQSPRVILQDGAIVIGGLDMSAALPKAAEAKRSDAKASDAKTSAPKAASTPKDSATPTESPLLVRVEPASAGASVKKDSA
jgi:cytoskeletal protein CcmA (bactofilin family)